MMNFINDAPWWFFVGVLGVPCAGLAILVAVLLFVVPFLRQRK